MIVALRLVGLKAVAKELLVTHLLCVTTDAASDNTGLGKKRVTMDSFSRKNLLLESLTVSDRVWSDSDENFREIGLLDILHVIHHWSEKQVRTCTAKPHSQHV